jgi:hypothetical protein
MEKGRTANAHPISFTSNKESVSMSNETKPRKAYASDLRNEHPSFTGIAVGTAVAGSPRTDLYVKQSRIRLLRRVLTVTMFPSLSDMHGGSCSRSQIPDRCPVQRRVHHDSSSVTSFPRRHYIMKSSDFPSSYTLAVPSVRFTDRPRLRSRGADGTSRFTPEHSSRICSRAEVKQTELS